MLALAAAVFACAVSISSAQDGGEGGDPRRRGGSSDARSAAQNRRGNTVEINPASRASGRPGGSPRTGSSVIPGRSVPGAVPPGGVPNAGTVGGAPAAAGAPGAGGRTTGGAGAESTPLESVNPKQTSRIAETFNPPEAEAEGPEELPEGGGKEEPQVTLLFKQSPIEKIFEKINKDTGIIVKAMGETAGQKVDIRVKDASVRQALEELALGKDWTWIRREDGSYEIWDKENFRDRELRKRVIRRSFKLRYVAVTEVQAAIEGVKSEVGVVAANPRTNELIVTDLPNIVAQVESILREIDVQLYTRVFHIRYADIEQLQEPLSEMKSPAGTMHVDPLNRIIVVTDTFEKIKQMEQLISLLDIDRPIKAYNLTSIGLDAEDADELIETFITPLATPDALIEFNPTQGILLVRDVVAVHDTILEMLKALDQTPKQVWIEGELLQVSSTFDFSFGTEFSFSGDMPQAIGSGLVEAVLDPITDPGDDDDDDDMDDDTGGGATATGTAIEIPDDVFPVISSGSGGFQFLSLTGNAKVIFEAAMSDNRTDTILQPRALVKTGEEVSFELTDQLPQLTTFFNQGSVNVNNNLASSSITFVPAGILLVLTPVISNRGLVEMLVSFENSSATRIELNTGRDDSSTQTAFQRSVQRVDTVLIVPSGETRVMGGLISRGSTITKGGVPWLVKIPIIGPLLFGRRTEDKDDNNLLFFITPTIVKEEAPDDLVAFAVNDAARAITTDIVPVGEFRPPINPVPPELREYIRSARPVGFAPGTADAADMADGEAEMSGEPDEWESAPGEADADRSAEEDEAFDSSMIDPRVPSGIDPGVELPPLRLSEEAGLMTSEPYVSPDRREYDISGRGFEEMESGVIGPSGSIGGGGGRSTGSGGGRGASARRGGGAPGGVPGTPGGPVTGGIPGRQLPSALPGTRDGAPGGVTGTPNLPPSVPQPVAPPVAAPRPVQTNIQ